MQNSLLTHIASDFISEYENVANSSICYFLNEYSCARDVLKKVIDIKDGRHPVIEQQLVIGEQYVSNDVYLDDSTQQIIMITVRRMILKSLI